MDLEKDAMDAMVTATDAQLKRLATLAKDLLTQEEAVQELTEKLELRQLKLNELRRQLLPDLMQDIGVSEFKLTSGAKVTVKELIEASIKAENRPKAFAWLRANKFDSLIKNEVVSRFGMKEDKKALALLKKLKSQGYDSTHKESIHGGTLKAFVRERIEAGKTLPAFFEIFEYREAKVERPKEKPVSV